MWEASLQNFQYLPSGGSNATYHIAGEFGGELNFVVWQSAFVTTKLKSAKISCSHIYMYGNPVPNLQIKICQYLCNGHLGPNRQI